MSRFVAMTVAQMNGQRKRRPEMPRQRETDGCSTARRTRIKAAAAAQKQLVSMTMEARESFIRAMRKAALTMRNIWRQLAHDETGYGRVPDKIQKILLVANKTPGTEDIQPQGVHRATRD